MKAICFTLSLLCLVAAVPATAAPKHILLNDSLLANADTWAVKQGALWRGIHKWRFDDYAVMSSKSGWATGRTRTNFLQTKKEVHYSHKFSFVLGNAASESAFVSTTHDVVARSKPGLKIGKDWTIDGDDRVHESDHFTASIAIGRDSTEAWALLIRTTDVSDKDGEYTEGVGTYTGTLTHGERRIEIVPAFSRKVDKLASVTSTVALLFSPPALGYEFIEDGRSLCAVEYFSSGLGGSAKNMIWMRRDTDPTLEFVLAAAMTAVLEVKVMELERGVGDPQE